MPLSTEDVRETWPQLPLTSRLRVGGAAYGMVAATRSINWLREWHQYFFPSEYNCDATKTYTPRPYLPVRIFIPTTYSRNSSTANLPTLFTIHGGGFTIGSPMDDDKWNRMFSETHEVLVIALNYSKAPFNPFPAAIHDLEALIPAILADTSLPIDKHHCAMAGFSAGGNLALAVAQLESVKTAFKQYGSPGFSAVIPLYSGLDRTINRTFKAAQRYYKPDLTPKRNAPTDMLSGPGKAFDWSYIPVGQDLRDPLLSPIFAPREKLPPHIFIIAVELDLSCHDAWRFASRLAGRPEPAMDVKCGRQECGTMGELELVDERFAWEVRERGVRWLLVPDALHGFDHLPPWMQGDETSVRDAESKSIRVIKEVGDWLKTRAWA